MLPEGMLDVVRRGEVCTTTGGAEAGNLLLVDNNGKRVGSLALCVPSRAGRVLLLATVVVGCWSGEKGLDGSPEASPLACGATLEGVTFVGCFRLTEKSMGTCLKIRDPLHWEQRATKGLQLEEEWCARASSIN